jgi:hypothetical protein
MSQPRVAFIVSRIGKRDSPERKNADEWLQNIVEPVCREAGITPIRSDQVSAPGRIDSQVSKYLLDSDIVIADLSGLNPNVMYEVGVRHALELPIVHMASEGTDLPFDFRTIRTQWYEPSFHIKSVNEARKELSAAILESLNGAGSPLIFHPDSGYSGINISGTWEVKFPDDDPHRRDITFELRQKGAKIWGFSTHIKKSEEIPGDPIRTYVQKGQVYNRFVQLSGQSPTPQRLLINSFLFEIVDDGRKMEGGVIAYSTVTRKIFSKECACICKS